MKKADMVTGVPARLQRKGRKHYLVMGVRGQYPSVGLAQDTELRPGEVVEQLLVEEPGLARLRRGDVVIRRVRLTKRAEEE